MWVAFANAKATHIFSAKNISLYAIFNDQSFNDTLANDIVSFKQLGPECNCAMQPSPGYSNIKSEYSKLKNEDVIWWKNDKNYSKLSLQLSPYIEPR